MDTLVPIRCPGCQFENYLSFHGILDKLRDFGGFVDPGYACCECKAPIYIAIEIYATNLPLCPDESPDE